MVLCNVPMLTIHHHQKQTDSAPRSIWTINFALVVLSSIQWVYLYVLVCYVALLFDRIYHPHPCTTHILSVSYFDSINTHGTFHIVTTPSRSWVSSINQLCLMVLLSIQWVYVYGSPFVVFYFNLLFTSITRTHALNISWAYPILRVSTCMVHLLFWQQHAYLECLHWLLHLAYPYGLPLGIWPHLYLSNVPRYFDIFGIYAYFLDNFNKHILVVLYLGMRPQSNPSIN